MREAVLPFCGGCPSVGWWRWLRLVVASFSALCASRPALFCLFCLTLCAFFATLGTVFISVVLVIPSCLSSLLVGSGLVGFSGSRGLPPAALSSVLSLRARSSGQSFVGCAAGVDADVRVSLRSARVFCASDFGVGRGAFAARSSAFVRALASGGGALVSFPSAPCPVGLLPSASSSRAFCGSGSGSWASLAFAVGSGVPCWVYAPFGVPTGWGFAPCGSGWFCFAPVAVQSSLF